MAKMKQKVVEIKSIQPLITYQLLDKGLRIADVFLEHDGTGVNIIRCLSQEQLNEIKDKLMEHTPA